MHFGNDAARGSSRHGVDRLVLLASSSPSSCPPPAARRRPGRRLEELRGEPPPGRDVRPAHRGAHRPHRRAAAQSGRHPGLLRGAAHRRHRPLPRVHRHRPGLASSARSWRPAAAAPAPSDRVRREFLARWDLVWLGAAGVRERLRDGGAPESWAERERAAVDLRPGAAGRRSWTPASATSSPSAPTGCPAWREVYGLSFGSVRRFQQALKYQAVAAGEIDVLDVYTTDGRLLTHDLVVLEDDAGFFPPYDAAALVRGETLAEHPEVGARPRPALRRPRRRDRCGGSTTASRKRARRWSAVARDGPGRAGPGGRRRRRRRGGRPG